MDNKRKAPKWSKTFIKHFLILILIGATVFGVWFYMAYDKDFSENVDHFNSVDENISDMYETAVSYNDYSNVKNNELLQIINETKDADGVVIKRYSDSDSESGEGTDITKYEVNYGSDEVSVVDTDYYFIKDGEVKSITDDSEALNRFTGRANFHNTLQLDGEYTSVYDKDLNKLTDTKKPIALAVKLHGLGDKYYSFMYTSDNKELYDILNSIKDSEYIDEDYKQGKVYKEVVLDSIYEKGSSFEPASGRLVEFKMINDGEEEEISSEELTFSKDPLKKGYVLSDLNGDAVKSVIGPVVKGRASDDESKYFEELEKIIRKKYPDEASVIDATSKTPESNMEQGTLGDNVYYNFYVIESTVNLDSGTTYSDYLIVANVLKYNFFRDDSDNTKMVIIAGAIAFALALIISIITSSISHSKKKTAYENEIYKDSVIESIAHDLKSPLTIIKGYAENLADASDSENEYISGIVNKIDDMNEIIDKSILMSKSKNIKAELNMTKVNVKELAEDIIKERADMLSGRDMTTVIEGECTLSTDYMWFKRVLINLIENAICHGDNGEIVVKLEASKITITNPFSKELDVDVSELKKPFAKGKKERNALGSGLGLSVAENILRQFNYKLEIEVGEGQFIATIIM